MLLTIPTIKSRQFISRYLESKSFWVKTYSQFSANYMTNTLQKSSRPPKNKNRQGCLSLNAASHLAKQTPFHPFPLAAPMSTAL
jgi:hypothetical protein